MNLDYETYSEIDLKKVGLARYARHPSTRIILAAWTDAGGNAKQYDERDPRSNPLDELRADLQSAGIIHAWNAGFEQEITEHVLKVDVPLHKWSCTMGHAQYRSLPASLHEACEALGMSGKIGEASRLIRIFCSPPKKGTPKELPDDWAKFRQYNADDIVLEAAVSQHLTEIGLGWPEDERAVYLLSQWINHRGVPVDVERAAIGYRMFQQLCREANDEIREITGIDNPNSPVQIKQWISERLGRTILTIEADAINALLAEQLPDDVRRVLLLRAGAAMSAPKKYDVAQRQAWEGVMRHMLQYSGAGRTHRWSGRGLQPHNMRRGLDSDEDIALAWDVLAFEDTGLLRALYSGPFKLIADLIRSIIRKPAASLAIADFSSIEVVMLYWAAGDDEKMKRFAEGRDPYKDFATSQFGVAYEEVTKKQRTFSKPPVLGGGYGLGGDTLVDYAAGMGVKMAIADARRAISTYRNTHPLVVALWSGLESAMKACITSGKAYRYRHFIFERRGDHVLCRLPAGTEITYMNARIEQKRRMRNAPDEVKADPITLKQWKADPDNWYWTDQIIYDGVNQYTGAWGPIDTWGGKLTENIVQSISRDVLVHALQAAHDEGLDIVLHVHDEIVAVGGERELKRLQACMVAPPWCPDAAIRSAGFVAPAYRKD